MLKIFLFLCCVLSLVCMGPTTVYAGNDSTISVQVSGWDETLTGEVKTNGETFDLTKDLAIDQRIITQFGLDIRLSGKDSIYLHYFTAENAGNNTVSSTTAKVNQTVADAFWGHTFANNGNTSFEFITGVRYVNTKTEINDSGNTNEAKVSYPQAVVGVGFKTQVWQNVSLRGSVSGLDLGLLDNSGKSNIYDYKLGLAYAPVNSNFAVGFGYKKLLISGDEDDVLVDMEREGSYFEAVIQF